MNITEANATQLLLDWLTGEHCSRSEPVSEHQAREAACYLTDRAALALGTGRTAVDVAAAWSVPIGVCALCPTRVPAAELVPHIRSQHPGVLGEPVDSCERHTLRGVNGGPVAAPSPDCPDCVAGRRLPVVDVNADRGRPAVRDFRDEPHDVDWASIAVGDVDPTAELNSACGERLDQGDDGLWSCTRPAGHTEVHVAGDGAVVCAVWG